MFRTGVGHFRWKGTIASNPCWSGKTRDIPVPYDVEILTDNNFVLSQYTHLTNGQTDRIARAILCVNCITCSRMVKMD